MATFPQYSDEQILQYFVDSSGKEDVPVTVANLKAPNRDSVTRIFTFFLREIMGFNLDAALVLPFDRDPPQFMELYQDRLPFLQFFGCMQEWLTFCHYTNFNIDDLQSPRPKRFRRQLSALINFSLFNEKQDDEFADEVVQKCQQEDQELIWLQEQIDQLKQNIQQQLPKIEECKLLTDQEEAMAPQRNREFSELNEKSEDIPQQLRTVKAAIADVKDQLQGDAITEAQLAEEIKALEEQLVSSPEKFRQSLRDADAELRDSEEQLQLKVNRRAELLRMLQDMDQPMDGLLGCKTKLDALSTERKRQQQLSEKLASVRAEKTALQESQEREEGAIRMLESRLKLQDGSSEATMLKESEFVEAVDAELQQRKTVLQDLERQFQRESDEAKALALGRTALTESLVSMRLQFSEQNSQIDDERKTIMDRIRAISDDYDKGLRRVTAAVLDV